MKEYTNGGRGFSPRLTERIRTVFKTLRRHLAWRSELRSLKNSQTTEKLIAPDGSTPGVLLWRLPVPGKPDVFMSVREGYMDHEHHVVQVDATAFNHYWLKGGLNSPDLPSGCKLRKEMPHDYKYSLAAKNFATSKRSPVPLAPVGIAYDRRNRASIALSDGVTRTFWLLFNGVKTFPVLVNGADDANTLARLAGIKDSVLSVAELFQRAEENGSPFLSNGDGCAGTEVPPDLELLNPVDEWSPDGEIFIRKGSQEHEGNFAIVSMFDARQLAVVSDISQAKRIAMMASSYSVGGYGSVVIEATAEACTHVDELAWLSAV